MTSAKPVSKFPGYFPINVKIADREVLVVGGGRTAMIESRRLIDFGAQVHLVAPHMISDLQEMAPVYGHKLKLSRRKFDLTDEDAIASRKYALVFACAPAADENEYIAKLANEAGVAVCLPDHQDSDSEATFVVPATRKRGHIKISVSTDGFCPPLARVLLERIEASLGGKIDKYVLFIETLRERLAKLNHEPAGGERREQTLSRLFSSEELIMAFQRENFEEALQLVDLIIDEASESN